MNNLSDQAKGMLPQVDDVPQPLAALQRKPATEQNSSINQEPSPDLGYGMQTSDVHQQHGTGVDAQQHLTGDLTQQSPGLQEQLDQHIQHPKAALMTLPEPQPTVYDGEDNDARIAAVHGRGSDAASGLQHGLATPSLAAQQHLDQSLQQHRGLQAVAPQQDCTNPGSRADSNSLVGHADHSQHAQPGFMLPATQLPPDSQAMQPAVQQPRLCCGPDEQALQPIMQQPGAGIARDFDMQQPGGAFAPDVTMQQPGNVSTSIVSMQPMTTPPSQYTMQQPYQHSPPALTSQRPAQSVTQQAWSSSSSLMYQPQSGPVQHQSQSYQAAAVAQQYQDQPAAIMQRSVQNQSSWQTDVPYSGNPNPHVQNDGGLAAGFRVSAQHQQHFAEQRVQRDGSGNSTSVTYSRSSSSHEFSFRTSRSQQGTPSSVCICVDNISALPQCTVLSGVQTCFVLCHVVHD